MPLMVLLVACSRNVGGAPAGAPQEVEEGGAGAKVVIFGIPAVTWGDLDRADVEFLDGLIERSAVANVAVRVSNHMTEAYATLGAGQRADATPSASWAFDRGSLVERSPVEDVYERLTGHPAPPGDVLVPYAGELTEMNDSRGFDATPGRLAARLERRGRNTAVIGNADISGGPLPTTLPVIARTNPATARLLGVNRAAALAVMNEDGAVGEGSVSRDLLAVTPEAPFGVSLHPERLLEEFRRVSAIADLIMIETGETERADAYSEELSEDASTRLRMEAIRRTFVDLVEPVLSEVDLDNTLVIIMAPTTPGGPIERGQLRPLLITGADVPAGTAFSNSTRRPGLVWLPDVTATIAGFLDQGEGFDGRRIVVSGEPSVVPLIDRNQRAVVHDALRSPLVVIFIVLELLGFLVAVGARRQGSGGSRWGWPEALLLAALVFPLTSFVSTAGLWRWGPVGAGAAVMAAAFMIGGLLARWPASPERAADVVLAGTMVFLLADLLLGAPAQLDSLLGYTSVAAGRFFGLGNLGFALLAGAAFLVGGALADLPGRPPKISAVALLALVLVFVGHPRLGADVGGVLAMAPAIVVFAYLVSRQRGLPLGWIPVLALGAVLLALIFGAIDLARPEAERTHLGLFLARVIEDPMHLWLVVQRKAGLAVSLAISTRWGLAVPGAAAVFIWLHRRRKGRWRQILRGRAGIKAGLDSLIVAAVVGSLVNDSGVAIAGMMLALAAPWALLVAASREGAEGTA